jgi:FKBP-type peptidyl-prolyl cis-trans isomerase FkpA/FKBP-type peptidyl-prolyl cis-trans isomerase FklB
MRKSLVALCLATVLSLAGARASEPVLNTDQDKTLYAIGLALGANVANYRLTAAELDLVKAGLTDAVLGREAKVDLATYQPKLRTLAQERTQAAARAEKDASKVFLDKLAGEQGAERTASGLVYVPMKPGTGPHPAATDRVKVHYHGTLRDGTVFDSSVQRGEPATFPLNSVIRCWTEGLQKMQVGGKSKLACPSDIAYGDQGRPRIPPGAALVFEVELLEIEQPAAPKP